MSATGAEPGSAAPTPSQCVRPPGAPPAAAASAPPSLRPPGYTLRRLLGHGGAASVFAAEHVLVKRSVALKLPHIDPDLGEVLFARLRRETRALASVRHPVIVDVIDGGDDNGVPFLAMQLLEG